MHGICMASSTRYAASYRYMAASYRYMAASYRAQLAAFRSGVRAVLAGGPGSAAPNLSLQRTLHLEELVLACAPMWNTASQPPRGFGRFALKHASPAPAPEQAQGGLLLASCLTQPRPVCLRGIPILPGYRPTMREASAPQSVTGPSYLVITPTRCEASVAQGGISVHISPEEIPPTSCDEIASRAVGESLWGRSPPWMRSHLGRPSTHAGAGAVRPKADHFLPSSLTTRPPLPLYWHDQRRRGESYLVKREVCRPSEERHTATWTCPCPFTQCVVPTTALYAPGYWLT